MAEATVPTYVDNEKSLAPDTREESRYVVPPVDIYEDDDGLTLYADMPGVEKDQVHIRVDNGVLTIEGRPVQGNGGDTIAREFNLVNYYRQFTLAESVNQENIEAELKNGVLALRLPKAEQAKPRQIPVKTT